MTQSEGDGVGATASANLVVQVDEVSLDGRHREAELARNFLVGRTLGYLPQNLHLSSRQSVRCRTTVAGRFASCVKRRLGLLYTSEKAIDPCHGLVVDAAGD